ncbi:hypothetical protein [Halobaculum limi]|uniref:hypothetical protein n=1 Tax=Halobaculum limi TaxID=3031916 RepID=UPI0024073E1F|nr:hypothetical protein [Halobaculum sp. YSMS11]
MLSSIAVTYSAVFAPELFVLVCGLLIVVYEWRLSTRRLLVGLGKRIGALGIGWALAFVVYQGLPQLFASTPSWILDATGSLGLGIGLLAIWGFWRTASWGTYVPEFAGVLVAVTIPHLLITPFWDISSHVLYAVVPAGYLGLVDRRFFPLVVIALGMVAARPLAGAHTWLESVGGLVLGVLFVGMFFRERIA